MTYYERNVVEKNQENWKRLKYKDFAWEEFGLIIAATVDVMITIKMTHTKIINGK